MSEQEIIHKLEKKFEFIENIYFVKENERGQKIFSCIDSGKDSYLTVDPDGWVTARVKNKKYGDVLGTIH